MSTDKNERPLSFGERLVGISFNPAQNDSVKRIKEAAAAYADVLAEESAKLPSNTFEADLIERSTLTLLDSQMQAVKAVTWNLGAK